jgi:hypothetical protein
MSRVATETNVPSLPRNKSATAPTSPLPGSTPLASPGRGRRPVILAVAAGVEPRRHAAPPPPGWRPRRDPDDYQRRRRWCYGLALAYSRRTAMLRRRRGWGRPYRRVRRRGRVGRPCHRDGSGRPPAPLRRPLAPLASRQPIEPPVAYAAARAGSPGLRWL